jgi:Rrf2 family protein
MNVSAKKEYACLAVMELAGAYESGEPLQLRRIASKHGIPHPFLVQILLQLKAAGIVESTRGAAGGYRLSVPPRDLTLGAVMCVVDGSGRRNEAAVDNSLAGPNPMSVVLRETWVEVARAQREILEGTTFAELISRARGRTDNMYYI